LPDPALASTASVPVAFGIGRRVAGHRVALAAAALVAVNPMLVWRDAQRSAADADEG